MFNVGGGEILAILVIALIVLGPDKLPNAARQAGKYLNEFRRISSGFQDEIRGAMDLATTSDDTPVVMEPAQPTADAAVDLDADSDLVADSDLDADGEPEPGVATETVAFGDEVGPTANGSGHSSEAAANVAEAQLAVTKAKLAAAEAELAAAEARLAATRATPAPGLAPEPEPEPSAPEVPTDGIEPVESVDSSATAGSVPPGPAGA